MSDPREIYLQPECCANDSEGRLWCEHDAPVDCEDGVPWTKYVIAEEYERLRAEVALWKADHDIHLEAANRWSERASAAEAERDRLRAELGILSADSAELHRERDALRAEVAELKKANADVNAACCKEAAENDRLRAENEALTLLATDTQRDADNLRAEVERLRAEVEALRADAERWRFFVDHSTYCDNVRPVLAEVSKRIWYHATDDMSDTLVAAIDAARRET